MRYRESNFMVWSEDIMVPNISTSEIYVERPFFTGTVTYYLNLGIICVYGGGGGGGWREIMVWPDSSADWRFCTVWGCGHSALKHT